MSNQPAPIREIFRLPSPAPEPQALAHDGTSLWMGSRETQRIYGIRSNDWTVFEENQAPSIPIGMTVVGDSLSVVCAEPDDDRFIRRYVMGRGFKSAGRIACPDYTGSYIGYDGRQLQLTQWYNKKILALDEDGRVTATVLAPHGICGIAIVSGDIYLMSTDDEESDEYWVTRMPTGKGAAHNVALVPFKARSLAWDGERFWTNHRERHEIVAFELPQK